MTLVKIFLPAVLISCAVETHATCETRSAVYVIDVLGHSIVLNEEFKHSMNSGDDARYRSLRQQVEQYSEETTMPCMRRAKNLLVEKPDQKLILKLMEFVVSYENSADETVSSVMASVFVTHPNAVENELKRFPPLQRNIVLGSIEAGWADASKKLSAVKRRDRETRLRSLINPVISK